MDPKIWGRIKIQPLTAVEEQRIINHAAQLLCPCHHVDALGDGAQLFHEEGRQGFV
ncbi:hypothetical protein [Xanthomonas axonopodis]|uniref:hypothetical protein n=1 Tax=Xanthomonas axonopodis TaxID=53413 RepID=UPI0013CE7149|nr:hypothetical protein [Xanthomonas axonopodis]